MGLTRLEDWLRRISEAGDLAAVEAARALLLTDERIPDELRYVLDDPDDRADAADALLFLLGEGEPLIAAAIRAESGVAEIEEDLESNPIDGWPLADAVRAEAGAVDVANAVAGALGFGIPMVHGALHWSAGAVDVAEAVTGSGPPVAAAVVAEAGRIEISASVLAILGVFVAPVAEAVRAAAGTVEVGASVFAHVDGEVVPVGWAVREAAGTVAITEAVMARVLCENPALPEGWLSAMLDRELPNAQHLEAAARIAASSVLGRELTDLASAGTSLRAAVQAQAGTIALWDAVAKSIGIADPESVTGWDGAAVKQAVLAEAGDVDVVRAVMAKVRRAAVAPVAEDAPLPANGAYWFAAAVAAAATVLIVFGFSIGGDLPGGEAVANRGAPEAGVPSMVFAQADEIRVEDLNYADDATVQVIQEDGAGAAMIIWVDEGKTL